MKFYAVIISVIYKRSVMRVLTFKVAAYVLLCDFLQLGLVLGSWCGSSAVREGGGVMAGGVIRGESKIILGNMVCSSFKWLLFGYSAYMWKRSNMLRCGPVLCRCNICIVFWVDPIGCICLLWCFA